MQSFNLRDAVAEKSWKYLYRISTTNAECWHTGGPNGSWLWPIYCCHFWLGFRNVGMGWYKMRISSSTQPSFGQMLTPGIRPAHSGWFWCVIDHESGMSPAARCAKFTEGHGWAKIFLLPQPEASWTIKPGSVMVFKTFWPVAPNYFTISFSRPLNSKRCSTRTTSVSYRPDQMTLMNLYVVPTTSISTCSHNILTLLPQDKGVWCIYFTSS